MGTETRERVLQFIRMFKEKHGYAPTVREIQQGCKISSPSVVQYHLDQLQHEGLIARAREKFRSITVTREPRGQGLDIPVLGTIAAGHPVPVPSSETWEHASERISVSPELLHGKKKVYALRVRGNSMVDAMIADGDLVLMEPVRKVSNGDVVAVWLKNEQETTLKKIYLEGKKVRLQPCNPFMTPIYHSAENVEIQGRVVAVVRVHG